MRAHRAVPTRVRVRVSVRRQMTRTLALIELPSPPQVAIVFSSKTILTFIHLCAVSFSLVPIVVAQYKSLFTGVVSAVPTSTFGTCGKTLLVVVALQCLLDSYGNKQPQVIKVPSAKAQTKAKAGAEATAVPQKPRKH